MSGLSGKSILVVEDEPLIREILVEVFTDAGAVVAEAENGALAFAMIQRQRFDVVISDIRMPGGNGLDLMIKIKRHVKRRPKLFLCSGFSDVSAEVAADLGIIRMFAKPFDADEVVQVIASSFK